MEATTTVPYEERTSWLERPLTSAISVNWETVLFATILILAFVTRFYDLGARVMSHDETSHVYFSWRLYTGQGYSHDPVTHGPLQFHQIALSYFLFGDNDLTGRIPVALYGVATIAFLWSYRRYLGRIGTAVAAVLMLISPYMLYYSRYARNEAFVALFGVITLWAILRYLESGSHRYLFWLTAATVLHFTAKETSFIYTAQALIFLAIYLVIRLAQADWVKPENRARFLVALLIAGLLGFSGVGFVVFTGQSAPVSATETAEPAVPGQELPEAAPGLALSPELILFALAALVVIAAAYFVLRGYTLSRLREERSFDLLILLGTLVLPMMAPFPVKLFGWNPTDYTPEGMLRTAIFLVPLALLAIGIGLWWNPRLWIANAAVFYLIFTVFYTTLFTNGNGFFTGLVGSLGYWLEQQGVERGSQPYYYYFLIQVPVYEYLPALGSLLALGFGLASRNSLIKSIGRVEWKPAMEADPEENTSPVVLEQIEDWETARPEGRRLALALLGFWAITSFFAYTYAGEKMPWLTVHIAWPMILLSGWSFGRLIEVIDWSAFRLRRGLLVIGLTIVFFFSLVAALGSLLGQNPPFQGRELDQLRATTTFLTALITAVASGWGLAWLVRPWTPRQLTRLFALVFFAFLALITARTAFTASYINYDNANELLVYAHSGSGPKLVYNQIVDLSERITDGKALQVAYDDETTYPFWWYLRNFENQRYYQDNPTRDLREVPIILAGTKNYGKIEPVVGQAYYSFEHIRMWWPNQDYFNLTWERIWNAISQPEWRAALFQIWLNRDYTLFGELADKSSEVTLTEWSPADRMRMYVRKDVAAQVWNYGVGPSPEEVVADPYEGHEASLQADQIIGVPGSEPGQFQSQRDLVVAPDGSLYVADTDNHRIQHISGDGTVLQVWGSFSGDDPSAAPPGTFNQPWGIALGPDGTVYVADTWNHRVQKFTAEGEFITTWGFFGQAESPDAFWGPRDVAVDEDGNVLITDTGNKRIAIFDSEGNFIAQFGETGFGPGEFDEPVGLAINDQGRLYVADTWNQRIQSFIPDGSGGYIPVNDWEIFGWFGESLDNKPYITVNEQGHIFATDPEGYRVLEFTSEGDIVRYWGDFGEGNNTFGLPGSVAADHAGGIWVSDTGNGRLMHFTLPPNDTGE